MQLEPLEPRRVRYPRGAYGWVDLKIVTGRYLERLGTEAALTYLFLCAVGNCQGISFWSRQRMAQQLGLASEVVEAALEKLVASDLIASSGRVIQVLALPQASPAAASTLADQPQRAESSRCRPRVSEEKEAAAVAQIDEASIRAHEPEARARLAVLLGPREARPSVVQALAKGLALEARAKRSASEGGEGESHRG